VFDESIFPFAHLHPNAGAQLRAEISLLSPNLYLPMLGGYELRTDVDANPTDDNFAEHDVQESADFMQNSANSGDVS
jgi:hypothetical protein